MPANRRYINSGDHIPGIEDEDQILPLTSTPVTEGAEILNGYKVFSVCHKDNNIMEKS